MQAKEKEQAAKVLEQSRLQQEREDSILLVKLLGSRDRSEQANWIVKVLAKKGQSSGRLNASDFHYIPEADQCWSRSSSRQSE